MAVEGCYGVGIVDDLVWFYAYGLLCEPTPTSHRSAVSIRKEALAKKLGLSAVNRSTCSKIICRSLTWFQKALVSYIGILFLRIKTNMLLLYKTSINR